MNSAARMLVLAVAASVLQACLGTGGGSPEQPVPLVTQAAGVDGNAGLTPEEARAQAITEIRAKAHAHERQHSEAPYPDVFATRGPPIAIAHEQRSQRAIEAELGQVRSALERASDPEEVTELEARMVELQALGRDHERASEERIRTLSEEIR